MALDKPIVTEHLPDLWGAGPAPDGVDVAAQTLTEALIASNRRFTDAIITYIGDLHHMSMLEAALSGIGLLATVTILWSYAVYWWQRRREQRRLDRLARDIVERASIALSPIELEEAQERWPGPFAIAAYINERQHARSVAREQADLDEWFQAERDVALAEHGAAGRRGGWLHDEGRP